MGKPKKKKSASNKVDTKEEDSKWANNLIPDVVSLITQHLHLPDFIRFRAVCRLWRRSSTTVGPHCPSLWAFLPDKRPGANLLSLSESCTSYPRVQIPTDHHCIGSGFGWLVFATVSDTYTRSVVIELYLLNPITNARIPLPTIGKRTDFLALFAHGFQYVKAVLSSRPSATSDGCTVVIFRRRFNGQAYQIIYFNGQGWDTVDHSDFQFLDDIAFHRGKLYLLAFYGDLFSCEFIREGSTCTATPLEKMTHGSAYIYDGTNLWESGNLVMTSSGDILNIVVFSPNKAVKVTRFDFLQGEFVEVEYGYLDDQVVLLGPHASYCLFALDFPRLKKNCIYFIENYICAWYYIGTISSGVDVPKGIYRMEDNESEPLEPHLSWSAPLIFFLPSLT